MCLLWTARSDGFLQSYVRVREEKEKAKKSKTSSYRELQNRSNSKEIRLEFLDPVIRLLRRHSNSIDDQLCCHNDEKKLEVMDVDRHGFVTRVKCTEHGCGKIKSTACYDAKWTFERICDKSKLVVGDHICWHRPYVIWHHAIVTSVDGENITVVHYGDLIIQQATLKEAEKSCSTLYRINYQDCYDKDYCVRRAKTLLNECRYDMLERNCEHFSRWCKTGLTNSSQVGIFWTTIAKVAFMAGLRLTALIILGLFVHSYEKRENNRSGQTNATDVTYSRRHETDERIIVGVYILITTVLFIIYFLKTSGSQLRPLRTKGRDIENPCSCSGRCGDWAKDSSWKRWLCCPFFCLSSLCYRAPIGGILFLLCNTQRSPCTCYRRPCHLTCGLFWRIILREILAAAGILIMIFEIERGLGIENKSPIQRTSILMFFTLLAYLVGYLLGALLGRWTEACCECCTFAPSEEFDTIWILHSYYFISAATGGRLCSFL